MAWRLKFVQIIRLATSILRLAEQIQCDTSCAVERCFSRTGAKPAQQLSLQLSSGYSGSWWQQHGLKHFLARWERSLPDHWHQRYAIRPVLLETFRDIPRCAGTCYQTTNWIRAGQTQGRGKLDVHNEYALPIKHIWLKSAHRDWKRVINCLPDTPAA